MLSIKKLEFIAKESTNRIWTHTSHNFKEKHHGNADYAPNNHQASFPNRLLLTFIMLPLHLLINFVFLKPLFRKRCNEYDAITFHMVICVCNSLI